MIFRYDRTDYEFGEDTVVKASKAILAQHATGGSFSDLEFYQQLQNLKGCVLVELSAVHCFHNRYVFGVRSIYRCKFADGSSVERPAPLNLMQGGYYASYGGPHQESTLRLEPGEYIGQVRTRQGEITDQLIFETSLGRIEKFGGMGGDLAEEETVMDRPRGQTQVVAFAGTFHGVLRRIGIYSENRSWKILKPFLLTRELIKQDRAVVGKNTYSNKQQSLRGTLNKALQPAFGDILIAFVKDLEDDELFKHILSFLIATPAKKKIEKDSCY